MNSAPIISVIIPSYNNAFSILKSVNSVLEQNYKNVECIVIDDGSTDNTYYLLKQLIINQTIIYFKQENKGVSSARNLGIEKCKGNYVLFLDADDLLLPDALINLYTTAVNNNAEIIIGLEENHNVLNQFPYTNNIANLLKKLWPISSVLIKKNNIKWNEDLKTWEVIDFFMKNLKISTSAICNFQVTKIDHSNNLDRATYKFDHYHPKNTFNFFYQIKMKYFKNEINFEIEQEIDKILISNLYEIYKIERKIPSNLFIETKNISKYYWFKSFGISGFCNFFGIKSGIKIFYYLNNILGRA